MSGLARTVVLMVILYYITINATADIPNTLSLQWPTSVCKVSGVNCNVDRVKWTGGFTIHGLWPNVKPLGPEDPRCQAESFDNLKSQIKNEGDLRLERDLTNMWPSLNIESSDEEFWQHEWEAHGACTEPLMGVKEYFQKTIQLFLSLNQETALDILQNAGITLESTHSPSELIEKMQKMNRKPAIACRKLESSARTTYLIVEAQFCINATGTEIIDCQSSVLDASCPLNRGAIISFPAPDSSIQIHE